MAAVRDGALSAAGAEDLDDQIYVLGRDQITRLHDLNKDGEADFYENFNNDGLVTTNGHAYVACLERDRPATSTTSSAATAPARRDDPPRVAGREEN